MRAVPDRIVRRGYAEWCSRAVWGCSLGSGLRSDGQSDWQGRKVRRGIAVGRMVRFSQRACCRLRFAASVCFMGGSHRRRPADCVDGPCRLCWSYSWSWWVGGMLCVMARPRRVFVS
ncbi:MAG: hypothetical protein QOJ58_4678, partial [Alphaproteobacteria bacterium]|nr:hypothetical protein [Alphaproteobacteria bacterium]